MSIYIFFLYIEWFILLSSKILILPPFLLQGNNKDGTDFFTLLRRIWWGGKIKEKWCFKNWLTTLGAEVKQTIGKWNYILKLFHGGCVISQYYTGTCVCGISAEYSPLVRLKYSAEKPQTLVPEF